MQKGLSNRGTVETNLSIWHISLNSSTDGTPEGGPHRPPATSRKVSTMYYIDKNGNASTEIIGAIGEINRLVFHISTLFLNEDYEGIERQTSELRALSDELISYARYKQNN